MQILPVTSSLSIFGIHISIYVWHPWMEKWDDIQWSSSKCKAGHSRQGCSTALGPTTGLVLFIQADPFRWVIHEGSKTVILLAFKTEPRLLLLEPSN
ncbi:hypothetical protein AVEN_176350-1 [Araneus ventricosus]|uniref:Uncharacterized protein n=1 Tax=Araneus ventricosus TaxID=182803 RepID=A0A4Y2C6V8_ARAVE|nr:hypothetical protein AVEN_176350-1 [Araneus ventricosus]